MIALLVISNLLAAIYGFALGYLIRGRKTP